MFSLSLLVFFASFGVAMARPEAQIMIVFLFFALVLGAVINLLLVRFAPSLPYTVVVFTMGATMTFIFSTFPDDNVMKQSEVLWNGFEPELLLYVFLPVLLFGEAMSLNFYHVRRAFASAVVLAGPGVLFGTFLMATVMKYILPYGWNWNLCLIFGSIMSATDPVAAVALLKSVGASHGLTYLIIGESLMNDGTALVLYGLFSTLVKVNPGPVFTVSEVAVYFLRVIFISPLLGFAFGLASALFLGSANHRLKEEDSIVQMAITICCAYLSFFTAEYIVGVSGVLCCCAAAITLSCYAQPLFIKPESLHTIWSAFEWIGNTLIFIFAGSIIGSRSSAYVTSKDAGYIVVVYIFTFVIRGLTLLLAYPAIRLPALGRPTSPKEAVFMTWAGMRGAVSMALALSLVHSTEQGAVSVTRRDSHIVFFLVGGEVLLNLLINATTAAPLLDFLKLIDKEHTAERVMMFNFVRKRVRVEAAALLDELKKSRPDQIDADLVVSYCSILRTVDTDSGDQYSLVDRDSETASAVSPLHRATNESIAMSSPLAVRGKKMRRHSDIVHDDAEDVHPVPDIFERPQRLPALVSRIRTAFLEVVRVSYKHQIHCGKLPRNATCVLVLLNSVEEALERVDETGLQDWALLEKHYADFFASSVDGFSAPRTRNTTKAGGGGHVALGGNPAQGKLARMMQDYRNAQVVYVLTSFIDAHHYAQKRIPYYLGETYSIDTPEEACVVKESRAVVARAKAHLAAINPQVMTLLVSKQTARWILHRLEDQVETFQKEGIIPEADAEILLHQAAVDLKSLGSMELTGVATGIGEKAVSLFNRASSSCSGV